MRLDKVLPYIAAMGMVMALGLTFLFSKVALDGGATSMVILSLRFSFAAITLWILKLLKLIQINLKGRDIRELLILALPYPIMGFTFEMMGLQYASTAQGGIMVSLLPVMASILGVFILREKPRIWQWMFVFCSVIGVLINTLGARNQGDTGNLLGAILFLIANFGGALNNVLSRKASRRFRPVEISFVMACCGAVVFTAVAVIQGLLQGQLAAYYAGAFSSWPVFGSIFYLGVAASGLGFFCMNYTLSRLSTVKASVFTNLAAVVSILAGVVFLHEPLHSYQIFSAIFILAGVIGTNLCGAKESSAPDPDAQASSVSTKDIA